MNFKKKSSIIAFIIFVFFASCKKENYVKEYFPNGKLKILFEIDDNKIANGKYEEYYETGELKIKGNYINGKLPDTVFEYYKNQKIKEKGFIKNQIKNSWWSAYDSLGNLRSKIEYISMKNSNYKNQTIYFDKKGDTIFESSSYYKLYLPDTLTLGKNIGRIKYHSNFKTKDNFFYILIDNQISENEIVKDTFNEEKEITRFGVFAHKIGLKKVKGIIVETILDLRKTNNDSATLTINKHKKYFEKLVFVKPK